MHGGLDFELLAAADARIHGLPGLGDTEGFVVGHFDGWREVITTGADERRYEGRVSSPCSPDLAASLLGGSLASA